jgi:hypothetical protein
MQPVGDFVVEMMRVTRRSMLERLLEEQSRRCWYRRRGSLARLGLCFKKAILGPGQREPNITMESPNKLRVIS